MKKVTVSIGIPAYNEEANIGHLLKTLLKQKETNFSLNKIIVISDGSTDKTVAKVKNIIDPRIVIIAGTRRKGKSYRLNSIFRKVNSDVLVLIDADVLPEKDSLGYLISCLVTDENLGLVAGNITPINNGGFIGACIVARDSMLTIIRKYWKDGINVYAVKGGVVALSKVFYTSLKMPYAIGDDAYIYFQAKKLGYKVNYCDKSKIRIYVASTIKDYFNRSRRFVGSQINMRDIFGDNVIDEYRVPLSLMLRAVFKQFVSTPLFMVGYLLLFTVSKLSCIITKPDLSPIWEMSLSTKYKIQ